MNAFSAVGVIVPAHNEQDHVEASLRHLRRALDALPGGVRVAVCVVLDRCTDRTEELVAERLRGWPAARAHTVAHRPAGTGVGWLRHLGLCDALSRLGGQPLARTWLLSTDADTTVPGDWVTGHLRHARAGAHGVAGLAELDDPAGLTAAAQARYGRLLTDLTWEDTHGHVYAANLGVRADAYLDVGGFARHGPGEEHRLWRALRAAGAHLAQPHDPGPHQRPAGRTGQRRTGRSAARV